MNNVDDMPPKWHDCPKCGAKIWKRVDRMLASNPPQYQYECDCGWTGYHTI